MFVSYLPNNMGCRVTAKRTGGDVSEYLNHNCPDLLLLDLHMPGIPGLEILRRIRESGGDKSASDRLPVTVLTTDAAAPDASTHPELHPPLDARTINRGSR